MANLHLNTNMYCSKRLMFAFLMTFLLSRPAYNAKNNIHPGKEISVYKVSVLWLFIAFINSLETLYQPFLSIIILKTHLKV